MRFLTAFLLTAVFAFGQSFPVKTDKSGALSEPSTFFTANAAALTNAVLPSQTGNNGKMLQTNGSSLTWAVASGSGTVTNFSVVPANGVSASVANPTTAPAATFTLGAITPTTVFGTGTSDASDATGTTGSLGTRGGLSVARKGYFGSDLFVGGNITASNILTTPTANGIPKAGGDGKIAVGWIPTTDLQIILRQGTDAERQTVTFTSGEAVWTTDTKQLWMGDGATLGGVEPALYNRTLTGSTIVNSLSTPGPIRVTDVTDANDASGTTGSLGTLGGLSVAKSARFGGYVRTGNVIMWGGAGGITTSMLVGDGLQYNTTGNHNVSVGIGSMYHATEGSDNSSIGYQSLHTNLVGTNNFSGGSGALLLNLGSYNTAVGAVSLSRQQNQSGNVALGYYAGAYELGSNALYVDNQNRTNTTNDKAKALIYGTFATDETTQTLKFNVKQIGISTPQTPASATASGTTGTVCWDADYVYVCTFTNTWKRAALSTW